MGLAALLLSFAFALAPQHVGAPTAKPGPVVLLGSDANESDVPELREAREPRLVLRAGAVDAKERDAGIIEIDARSGDDRALCERVRAAARIDLQGDTLLAWYHAL